MALDRVRNQQLLDDGGFVRVGTEMGGGGPEPTAKDRLDAFAPGFVNLVFAVLAIGAGAATRVLADYAQARVGSSITGFQVGDRFPDDERNEDLELEADN